MKNSDKKKISEHLSRQNFADGPSAAFFTDSEGVKYIVKVKRVFGVRVACFYKSGRKLPCRCDIIKLAKASALREISGRYRYEKHVWRKDGL